MRILVIDDEALIVRSLTRLLRAHDVVGASCGTEALAVLELDAAFDGVFCDVRMPDADGTVLAGQIQERWPHLAAKICMCSGSESLQGDLPRLEKPFSRDALLAQVSRWEV
jgi:DNA-binding NtrC family response regulator